MATKIRSEISKKKVYWLPKHRQLELVHFCLQYPDWKMRLATLDGYSGRSSSVVQIPEKNGTIWKPVERTVEERMMLEMKIRMVESAAYEAANDLYEYLLKGVTQGVGYEMLNVPCYSPMLTSVYSRLPKPISAACSSVCRPLRDSMRWISDAPSSAAHTRSMHA